jgi:hypothetical protein
LARVLALIAGATKHFSDGEFTFGGTTYTTPSSIQIFQGLANAMTARDAAQASAKGCVSCLSTYFPRLGSRPLLRDQDLECQGGPTQPRPQRCGILSSLQQANIAHELHHRCRSFWRDTMPKAKRRDRVLLELRAGLRFQSEQPRLEHLDRHSTIAGPATYLVSALAGNQDANHR